MLRIGIVSVFFGAAAGVHASDEIRWVKDWPTASKAAERGKKVVMVDFYTDWCGWCKRLDKDTYTDKHVIELSRKLVALKLDAEKEGKQLAARYKVRGFPTILFLDAKGEVVGRIGGYKPPVGFAADMTKFIELGRRIPEVERTLKADPSNGEANAWMAAILAARDQVDEAEAAVARAEDAKFKGDALVQALLGVGDAHQDRRSYEAAIKCFRKAEAGTKNASDRAYALVSIMVCHLAQNDRDSAKTVAKEVLAVKDAPAEMVNMAKSVLAK